MGPIDTKGGKPGLRCEREISVRITKKQTFSMAMVFNRSERCNEPKVTDAATCTHGGFPEECERTQCGSSPIESLASKER